MRHYANVAAILSFRAARRIAMLITMLKILAAIDCYDSEEDLRLAGKVEQLEAGIEVGKKQDEGGNSK